jgi:hypothetical protein
LERVLQCACLSEMTRALYLLAILAAWGRQTPNAAVNFDVLVMTYGVVNQVGGTVVGGVLSVGLTFEIKPVHLPSSASAWLCEKPVVTFGAISARDLMNEGFTPASANTARQRV